MNHSLRIIFMGTPEFAVPSLQVLVEHGYHIVAVVTAPDKPSGRGLKMAISPVKEFAVARNIPVLQPEKLKSADFLQELQQLNANLQVVVAFRMLPEIVWTMPQLGTFNLHASLLPQYRGAAPINWAIINGERETGVTTFFLQHEIDTGNIIFQEKEPIHHDDDAGTLYARLMHKGAALVLKTANAIEQKKCPSQPQILPDFLKHAPKIFKENCEINWEQSAESIYNFIRGLAPYPAAWTIINGKTYKIFKAIIASEDNHPSGPAGSVHTDNKTYVRISALKGALEIIEWQLEGKKRLHIIDFLRGNTLA